MAYATQQSMIDRFGRDELAALTNRGAGESIDPGVLAKALADADAEIDGYLTGRYQLPLDRIPANLTRLAEDIARYRLMGDRATDAARKHYEDAVDYLRDLSMGKVRLGIETASALPASQGSGPSVQAPERTFTQETLKGFEKWW